MIFRNIPHIHVHEKRENRERWHGAEIQIVIEGNWTTYRVWFSNLTLSGGFVCYELHWFLLFNNFLCFSAVENTALHAANGCHYTICTISFQVSFRISRVLALSISLHFLLPHWVKNVDTSLFIFCSKNVAVRFARRTDIMPPAPLETKYHPSAVDLLLIKKTNRGNFETESFAISSTWICECWKIPCWAFNW